MTPSDLSSARMDLLRGMSSIRNDSVSSSSRFCGSKFVSLSTFLIVVARHSCRNCLLERFIETGIFGSPRLYQSFICVHALRSTHSPMASMRPVSSAIGMNCPGDTRPYSGCCQRSNASTPANRPVFAEISG